MAEKDADDNPNSFENDEKPDGVKFVLEENDNMHSLLTARNKNDGESLDLEYYLPSQEANLKKEENPFSFKKFLNQDLSVQKNQGARKKTYSTASSTSSSKLDLSNHCMNKSQPELNSRVINTSDVSSVLPDFVQDHLVIEQCYLSGSSPAIDIGNLNLHNLPDLNLEHRNVHFSPNTYSNADHSSQSSSEQLHKNLPDFTLDGARFQSGKQYACNNRRLPDFTLNATTDSNHDANINFNNELIKRKSDVSDGIEASQPTRHRAQISSSPSVPLDLPSYESSESNPNIPIPFDLTIPAEEKNNINRGINSTETVSKSLPDFLSDGPIKKELDENLQNVRVNSNVMHNGLPPLDSSVKRDQERLIMEIDILRRQLAEKNRRLEVVECELEHLHSTDQRDTVNLEYALQEVENNLKQTAKRALNAEDTILKLKQENKLLKAEISSLRSENAELRLGKYESQGTSSQEMKNQRIAKELKSAANIAENSLRSLLHGLENLKVLADSLENVHKFQDNNEDYQPFSHEDSASGPAL